jgi:hypothetical protein
MTIPFTSIEDRLTEQFYRWELRGRGWQLWEEPVEPEPPFVPYFGNYVVPEPFIDDGQKPTLLSGLVDWLHSKLGRGSSSIKSTDEELKELGPAEWADDGPVTELQLSIPADTFLTPASAAEFLVSMSSCRRMPSFEVIGIGERVTVQFGCAAGDALFLRSQLEARFPEIIITPTTGYLERHWTDSGNARVGAVVLEMGLGREFMLPLARSRTFAIDPLTAVTAAIAAAELGEVAVLQVLFRPARYPWAESILRSVTFPDGSALFTGFRDFIHQARQKISRPLFSAVLRVGVRSADEDRVTELGQHLVHALAPLDAPDGNELIVLGNDGYDVNDHQQDLLLRRTRRSGMLLSSEELASIVHLPSDSVQTTKLRQRIARTKAAPSVVRNHGFVLGENRHAGDRTRVMLSSDQRVRHMHVIGASGTGKSTLLLNLIIQDIQKGDGVAVLDPHGDLIDTVIKNVPSNRANDVILFDPSDEDYPIGFNILSAHSAVEKNLLASDLVSVFRRLSSSWGDQMTSVLGNAILAFLESGTGGTLADLRRFLVEPGYRKEFLNTVNDPEIVYYWSKEFPLLTGRPHGPVLTRLDTFLRPRPIRHMVAQRQSRLDFAEIMDDRRIFLARLAHGAVGEENAHLLGALLVSKFHQMALGRQRIQESQRNYFWMYVDEFQNFATPSMAALLSGVRKYRLGLILAHQELHQLDAKAPDVASALMSNAYTRVCFRVGDQDARRLEGGFSTFKACDLQNLGTGDAIARTERAEFDFNLHTLAFEPVDDNTGSRVQRQIIALSREKYATRRSDVEAELMRARGADVAADAPKTSPTMEERLAPKKPLTDPRPAPTEVYGPTGKPDPVKPKRQKPTEPVAPEPRSLGRGGDQHRYLQQLIKQYAEGLGYRAGIEENILGGRGIDVALRKGDVTIACEICITTDDVHELGNLRKCITAGYKHVVATSPDEARLVKLKKLVTGELNRDELSHVKFLVPEELLAFIQEVAVTQLDRERTVGGYKVKTQYKSLDADERRDRRQTISKIVANASNRVHQRKKNG